MPIFYSKIRCFCLFTTCSIVSFVYHIWYKFRLFTVCILPAGYNHQTEHLHHANILKTSDSLCEQPVFRKTRIRATQSRRKSTRHGEFPVAGARIQLVLSFLASPPIQGGGNGSLFFRLSLCSPARHGRSSLPGRNPRCFFCRSDQCTSLPSPLPADGSL